MYLHMLAPWYLGKIDSILQSYFIWVVADTHHSPWKSRINNPIMVGFTLAYSIIIITYANIYTSKYIKYHLRISQYFKISKWIHCISITYHKLSIFVQYYPMIINGIVSLLSSILFNKLYSYPLIPPLPLVSVQGGTGRAIYRSVHMSLTSPGTVARKGCFVGKNRRRVEWCRMIEKSAMQTNEHGKTHQQKFCLGASISKNGSETSMFFPVMMETNKIFQTPYHSCKSGDLPI